MSNQSQEKFGRDDLVNEIYERSRGEISVAMCKRLANLVMRRMERTGQQSSIEECADDCIWAYFQ